MLIFWVSKSYNISNFSSFIGNQRNKFGAINLKDIVHSIFAFSKVFLEIWRVINSWNLAEETKSFQSLTVNYFSTNWNWRLLLIITLHLFFFFLICFLINIFSSTYLILIRTRVFDSISDVYTFYSKSSRYPFP